MTKMLNLGDLDRYDLIGFALATVGLMFTALMGWALWSLLDLSCWNCHPHVDWSIGDWR